ncbi:Uncharacterized protein OBRU01_16139 [Operophtera brumata]|uniref:DUF4817 domain-containing protein n=1 Tax=Operophtera brumata TaxID=104452 RepID=A0A0L7L3V9_OPEBR|nr:Uncharacterized protein OBRU01_16139 [Operophtera brumata]
MPRVQYSAQEYCNMHFLYGECGGNASAAAALYRERYPNARHPDYRVFIRVHSCYLEGRISGRGLGGTSEGRPQLIDAQDIVLNKVAEDSTISVRDIARREGIAKSTVHRILKRRKFDPYHVTRVQTLQPRDFAARVTFCRLMLDKIEEDSEFFDIILWSDESSAKRDGFLNLHNLHSWQLTNPHLILCKLVRLGSVVVVRPILQLDGIFVLAGGGANYALPAANRSKHTECG